MAGSSRSKVKTGCRTCKLRKVKCDEGRPACRRCESTGRVCDGYGIWGGGSQSLGSRQSHTCNTTDVRCLKQFTTQDQASVDRPIRMLTLEANEKDSFEWFMTRSAIKLPGAFYSHRWTTLLFQASTTEPSIRHSMLALSSAHREDVLESNPVGSPKDRIDVQATFTAKQYNLAIGNLQPCFTVKNRMTLHVLLISCILFASTEFLRGNLKQGLLHLEHGLGLLQRESKFGVTLAPSPSTYVDGWVITLFTRFLVQAKLLGQVPRISSSNFFGPRLSLNLSIFRSPHHARRSLESITLRAFSLDERSNELVFLTQNEMLNELAGEKEANRVELQNWFRTYQSTLSTISMDLIELDYLAYRLLGLYYYLTVILVETCMGGSDEMRFDRCQQSFATITSRCISTYKLVFPNGKRDLEFQRRIHGFESYSGDSVSDIGWIAPLYFTAIKCRNHYIRHMAVHLLSLSPNREGIWDSVLAGVIARKIIHLEENGFYRNVQNLGSFAALDMPTKADLATTPLPLKHRISNLNVVLPEDKCGKVLLCCSRPSNETLEWISQEYDLTSGKWMDTSSDLGKAENCFDCD